MRMKRNNEPMTMDRTHDLPRRHPRYTEAARLTTARVETAVRFRRRHVLKVMVAVTGEQRSDKLELVMRRWGHDVGAVSNGEAAVEMARESQPDVALLEIDAPQFDRCQLAGLLRNELARPDCLIIAVTRKADRECRRQCREAGIDVVLSMPVNPSVLETLLWMEGTRVNRMLPSMSQMPGIQPESQEACCADTCLATNAEGTAPEMELLERICVAAGQTS